MHPRSRSGVRRRDRPRCTGHLRRLARRSLGACRRNILRSKCRCPWSGLYRCHRASRRKHRTSRDRCARHSLDDRTLRATSSRCHGPCCPCRSLPSPLCRPRHQILHRCLNRCVRPQSCESNQRLVFPHRQYFHRLIPQNPLHDRSQISRFQLQKLPLDEP